jgi:hypothetical protein
LRNGRRNQSPFAGAVVRYAFPLVSPWEGCQMKAPKKKPPTVAADKGLSKKHTCKFIGTDNPRHLRAIAALLRRPMPRENLDTEAGCSNGPELVAELRRRGLEVPCHRINFIDRDGFICRPGVYLLTDADRRKLHQWMAKRKQQGGA